MVKPQPPMVRLASPGTPAAEVFNVYQIVTLLSGLYIKGAQRQSAKTSKQSWDDASDSLLGQVGDAYDIWVTAQQRVKDGLLVAENQPLITKTARLAHRVVRVESYLNFWSAAVRWGRIMALIERQLLVIVDQLAEHHPYAKAKIAVMRAEIVWRQQSMRSVETAASKEAQELNQQYAVPVAF
jgi:hypothetical protein